jgi:succinoglycan biosynthesis transport protein ExoP
MSDERVELEKLLAREDVVRSRRGYPRGLAYPDASMMEDYGYGSEYGYGTDGKDPGNTELLRKLWRAVQKRKWLILSIAIVVTGMVATEVLRIRPSYTASAIVEIRRDSGLTSVGGSADADPENAVSINTKILMFGSRPLLEAVVTNLKLDQSERFRDVSLKRSRWATVKRLLEDTPEEAPLPSQPSGGGQTSLASSARAPIENTDPSVENSKLDRSVYILEAGMKVEPIKDTQALRISFTHADPHIAAAVANGLAQSFVQRNFQNKTERFANKTNWLDRSTRELKARVEEAEHSLADYSRDHNIFSTQGQATLTTDRLMRLHDQAARAESELLLKRSMFEEVQQGRGAHLPEAFTDTRITDLQKRLNELSVSAVQLGVNYGPDNPNLQEVQQQMAKIQEQIDASSARLEEKVKSDYAFAYRQSQSLKAALDAAKAEAVNQDQAAVQYNLLKQDASTARSLYDEFLHKANQANLEVAQQSNNVNIIKPARVPRSTDGLNKTMSIAVGFLASIAAGIGLAFGLELMDKTVKNVGEVSRYTQLPTLGVIPSISKKTAARMLKNGKKPESRLIPAESNGSEKYPATERGDHSFRFLRYPAPPKTPVKGEPLGVPDKVVLLSDRSAIGEAYRVLRTSVLFSTGTTPPKTILVTSGEPGEGKTTTVINTAISLSQLGASVLIIDADLRKPMTHRGFGLSSERGLSTYLSSEVDLEGLIQTVELRNLSVLPCGPIPANPSELISSDRMKELLRIASQQYDHILIDSPPLMHVTDPVILSTMVNGVILVLHGGKSSRDVVRQSKQMLSAVGANLFGVVLNNVSASDHVYPDFPYSPYDGDRRRDQDEARISNILS